MNQSKLFLFTVLLAVSMSACRTQYASFQATPQESFATHKAPAEMPKHEEMWQVAQIENKAIEEIKPIPNINIVPQQQAEANVAAVATAPQSIKPKKPFFASRRLGLMKTYHQVTKKFEQKSRRRDGPFWWFNERIKIGLVLLGVAILLGILSLQSLATLFGVAAIIFIAWGLARVF